MSKPVSPGVTVSTWTPTRAAGLARLEHFLPAAGAAYARDRNVDRGSADRANVSALSPWIRRRLITEEEVIAAVLSRHSYKAAEKFIQEVFWRSYWKGWLELRPGVFTRFVTERDALQEAWARDGGLERAMEGRTGIACFDNWVQELVEVGWLHNHARMWFASVWIFTLRLPWQLGASFFYKHLLDADPASNTLSWRWVAGLHTPGKHYLARAANIRDNTLGRFDPVGQLDECAAPLTEEPKLPAPGPLPVGGRVAGKRVALLLTEEDLHAESWTLAADVVGCAALQAPSPHVVGGPAACFSRGALEDGLSRAGSHYVANSEFPEPARITRWAKGLGIEEIVTAHAATGPIALSLDQLERTLAQDRLRLVRLHRPFDQRVWPHAKTGFFRLKEMIPQLIASPP